jgi:hypothetical protein
LSQGNAAHDTVSWHEVDRSIHIPLRRIAAEEPQLLRVLTDRLVHEARGEHRATTTHFGSST